MAALYTLRLVSTAWRDVVDRMPSLWTIISSTFPDDVNRTSLTRSGSSPLMIYFPGWYMDISPRFYKFLPIIEPHLQRCSFLALQLDPDFVDEVPWQSLPRVAALKILVEELPDEDTKIIEIPDKILENIRDIDLDGQIPVNWPRTLGHLRGLRTLVLQELSNNTITQEQILSVLLASPGIETLVINQLEIEDPPSNLSPSAEPISLPQLRSVTITTGGLLTNHLLRRIRPPPVVETLRINRRNIPSHITTSFWEETMASWVPPVQRLYQNSSERVVGLNPTIGCYLQACRDHSLSIEFTGLPIPAALRWIQDVITAVDGGPGVLWLYAWDSVLEGNDILEVLQTIQGLTEISVSRIYRLSQSPVEALLKVLGEPTADSIGTPDPRPTFPTLQKLSLHDWKWELDGIMDMVQRRYSMQSTGGQQVPELTLDISPLCRWYLPETETKIIPFYAAKALRELDGVKELRMGSSMWHWEFLAVIWDEEASAPARG
ncbi:hypothetical protein FRC01_006023 [Tulasnella sp. 417]|nr:hypothetical protein FRC01_006023 [Tulasnella sp. 417]